MRLAAIFIENYDFEKGGYTLNLGGHYFYDITLKNHRCSIYLQENENFIEKLFDDKNIITNISAIVGKNGSGKTTIIQESIRAIGTNPKLGFSLWEDQSKNVYAVNYFYQGIQISNNKEVKIIPKGKDFKAIYYSPHLDHKSRTSGIDISADRYLAEDLSNINVTFDAGKRVEIEERLKRKNIERFMKFQKSKYSSFITNSYGLLSDDLFRVTFTRHRIDANEKEIFFHNIPLNFRTFLNDLYLNIRSEYKAINIKVSSEDERFETNKEKMKNLILMDLFCLLVSLMEQQNTYLEEGHFTIKDAKLIRKQTENLKAVEKFKFWLSNYYYSKYDKKPLPDEETISILEFLYDYLDKQKWNDELRKFDWKSQSLYFNEKDIETFLNLNQKLILSLPKYYSSIKQGKQQIFEDLNHLQIFANFEFADRKLSSGETAMLNLFSRIFDFFDRKIFETQTIYKDNYYILFLDEADLGYHPDWKRTFVTSMINFCSPFFKKVGAKVQIVFSTHDPISLSDIPNMNITYLEKLEDNIFKLFKKDDPDRPKNSFAANITDLLSDSFFMKNGLIGDFAKSKTEKTIKWLNGDENDDKIYYKKLINQIDEPLLKYKLDQMYFEKFPKEYNREEAKKDIVEIARKNGLDINFNN
ncbi:AAA family ATPase [Psychroflexus sp. CAK57W]|uniref:AAA family ATPase n=1 Tax=Psychroflexus curvus TaxID=2873595 RepID=UPI001CCC2B08|nr:AAA family ATPase [Psychroflexus curvus]MBZ9786427.1 AAA family ATPase [Psychroflexus curvus]